MKAVKRGKNTFIHGRAYVAGDVTLKDGANIWCGACIRGDLAPVRIGKNTNVQDNATIHVGYGVPAVLGDHVTGQYVTGKLREWEEYRTQVTQWELEKYLVTY